MEKINFLRFAKISCFMLGLSSVAFFSSCSQDPEDDGQTDIVWDNSLPSVPVLQAGDFNVPYPEGHTFRSYDLQDYPIPVGNVKNGGHTDKFSAFMTMDSTSQQVRLSYFSLIEPETVEESDVDSLAKRFVEDFYCEELGYVVTVNETVPFAGYNARKIVAKEVWYKSETGDKVDCDFYIERYIFFDKNKKKVYSVLIQMPESLRSSRYKELYGIISGLKIK